MPALFHDPCGVHAHILSLHNWKCQHMTFLWLFEAKATFFVENLWVMHILHTSFSPHEIKGMTLDRVDSRRLYGTGVNHPQHRLMSGATTRLNNKPVSTTLTQQEHNRVCYTNAPKQRTEDIFISIRCVWHFMRIRRTSIPGMCGIIRAARERIISALTSLFGYS